MKRYIVCIVVVLIACVAQVNAVSYKGTYKGRSHQSAYMAPATATAPVATFQSTSAMPVMMSTANTLLNEDGTVNTEAYGVGSSSTSGTRHIRKDGIGDPSSGIDPPDEEDEDDVENGTPLGDGLWVLLLLAGAYILARTLRTKRAITK